MMAGVVSAQAPCQTPLYATLFIDAPNQVKLTLDSYNSMLIL
jgi:hypothetical protein